jgi:hypothetical protein
MADREKTLLAGRISRIQQVLGRSLGSPWAAVEPPPEKDRAYLHETGVEFSWNDLEWEKLTGEEQVDEEFLTEMAFPGFLAFVRGLLLEETLPDSLAPPQPNPAVVDGLLEFLVSRIVELEEETACCEGEEKDHREAELKMTARLVDLVIYLFFKLSPNEIARVEAALVVH